MQDMQGEACNRMRGLYGFRTYSQASNLTYSDLAYSNRQNANIAIPSGGIQSMLEEADADVLLLFDCCHSASVPTTDSQHRNAGVVEVISACGYEEIAAEVDEHSFTKALTHTLAIASKGLSFSVGELHSRVLSKLKCWAPSLLREDGNYVENAEGRLLYERQPRKTPIYSIVCETRPRRSILIAPLIAEDTQKGISSLSSSSSDQDTPSCSSAESSGLNFSNENGESSSGKQKMPEGDAAKFPKVLLAIRLNSSVFDRQAWVDWLRNAPSEAQDVHVDGVYDSFSTLLLVRMPVALWNLLPDNPAYNFVGFVTPENTLWHDRMLCCCLEICQTCSKKSQTARRPSSSSLTDQSDPSNQIFFQRDIRPTAGGLAETEGGSSKVVGDETAAFKSKFRDGDVVGYKALQPAPAAGLNAFHDESLILSTKIDDHNTLVLQIHMKVLDILGNGLKLRMEKLEELFANSQRRLDQRRRKSFHDDEIASSDTNSGFLTWLRRKVAARQDERGSRNPDRVLNSYIYFGNKSKKNPLEAEIESLQADIEDFEGSRKIILDDLLTGGDGHGLEWAWYCVSGGSHLIPAFS
jgi:hypothetical protein